MMDTITIIRGRPGKRLAKLICSDGTILDYDAGYRSDFLPQPVADLDALHRLIRHLLHRPDCAVVRGVPLDLGRCVNIRRLAFQCKKTGEAPTLRPEPHLWAALDLDAVERPESIPADDLLGLRCCCHRSAP